MSPAIPPGALIHVAKWGFGHYDGYGMTLYRTAPSRAIRRGDILALDSPEDARYRYVKRVVGVRGDLVEYVGKRLKINGASVATAVVSSDESAETREETLDHVRYRVQIYPAREDREYSVRLDSDEYFVLGDNRDNSKDSRHFGPVPARNIVGRVVLVW